MTSSNAIKSSNCIQKSLTNFSIESIIGLNVINDNNEDKSNDKKVKKEIRKYRPKNFQCPECKMAFSNNGQLKNHIRIHTGERPFRCNHLDCNKTFTRNEELTRHKLIHTGVRPHCCNSCGKRFGRKDHLKKHIRTHDRKKFKRKTTTFNNLTTRSGKTNSTKTPISKQQMLISEANITKTQPVTTSTIQQNYPIELSGQISSQQFFNPMLTTTTNVIQQYACDYWNKWYNLIGFCRDHHHQQQQQNYFISTSSTSSQLNASAQLDLFQRKL